MPDNRTLALVLVFIAIGCILIGMVRSIRANTREAFQGIQRTSSFDAPPEPPESEWEQKRIAQLNREDAKSDDEDLEDDEADREMLALLYAPIVTAECKCEGCGAQVEFHDNRRTGRCGYCRRFAKLTTDDQFHAPYVPKQTYHY